MVYSFRMKKYTVKLSKRERKTLIKMARTGKDGARSILRAHILMDSDAGLSDRDIALRRGVDKRTIARIRERYDEGGWKRAVYDAARPGQPKILDDDGEAKLVAIACSDPPEGRSQWTLELLRERLIADKVVDTITTVTIFLRLKSRGLKPWLKKNVVRPEAHGGVH